MHRMNAGWQNPVPDMESSATRVALATIPRASGDTILDRARIAKPVNQPKARPKQGQYHKDRCDLAACVVFRLVRSGVWH